LSGQRPAAGDKTGFHPLLRLSGRSRWHSRHRPLAR
jgi:hypothetical protein